MSDSSMAHTCANREAALVEHAIAGDGDAFGELYLMHLDAIYRYVYFRVGGALDAEDLTEQVFLQAWKALPEYEPRSARFSSWLYRIAHNVIVDYYRSHRPLMTMEHVENQGHMDAIDVCSEPKASLVDQVIKDEEDAALAAAIAQLPEDQQQVIVLRFIEGHSHAYVAQLLNKSEGACRVIQHRALAALNKLLVGVQVG